MQVQRNMYMFVLYGHLLITWDFCIHRYTSMFYCIWTLK